MGRGGVVKCQLYHIVNFANAVGLSMKGERDKILRIHVNVVYEWPKGNMNPEENFIIQLEKTKLYSGLYLTVLQITLEKNM